MARPAGGDLRGAREDDRARAAGPRAGVGHGRALQPVATCEMNIVRFAELPLGLKNDGPYTYGFGKDRVSWSAAVGSFGLLFATVMLAAM